MIEGDGKLLPSPFLLLVLTMVGFYLIEYGQPSLYASMGERGKE
jgi:hypothetical protein